MNYISEFSIRNPQSAIRNWLVAPVVLLMTIDQVAGAGAGARADQRAFLAADQRAADRANCRADSNVFGLAGAAIITMMAAVLRRACRGHRQHHENDRQQHRQDVSFLNNTYHFHPSLEVKS